MNLPVGKLIEEALNVSEINFEKAINSLIKNSFTGYIVLTVEGSAGIEEGILIFKKGRVIGSTFEYTKFDVNVYGNGAINHFFNSTCAQYGIADIHSLTTHQVDMIVTFNEKIKILADVSPKTLNRLVPSKYNEKLAKQVLADALSKQESRHEVFRKLGLTDLGGE